MAAQPVVPFAAPVWPQTTDTTFTADMTPLLAPGQTWNLEESFEAVQRTLVSLLPGDPWKAPDDSSARRG